MRNEEIIIDLADPVFTKTIRSRQNDKNGLEINVNVRELGNSVDLTGYAVKYEATNHTGAFIRDDAQIIDAKNGVFSYTFTSQAVSTSADWTAYFVMEKNAERTSTPDIRIVLKRDVKEGNMKIENYISDFEKAIEQVAGYRKEIDDTNKRIIDTNNKFVELTTLINAKGVQVPKITTESGGQTISVSDITKNILDEIAAKGAGMNTIYCATGVQNTIPSSKPWRGISYFNQNNIGFVIAKDSVGGFYVSHHMYNQYGLNKVKADFLWIPRYGSNKPAYACDLWQYADGETGGWLDGVEKVDLNVLNGDKPLSWFIGGNELNPINPIDPIQPIQKEGIGHATSKYDDGYGVNLYENPADPIFAGRITQKIPYLIQKGYWGGGEKNMICLGNEKQWAYLKHFDVQWFYAYTKYWSGYQIRTYDGPNGNDTGFVDGSEPYQLFNRQDGHIDIGGNRWIREEHVIIK
ncbi:BppU family phage baseplate upper protein [Bacillus cereus]|uniref:BppU family phage baseplate upper protein n=1 Tax=Bacillus cereus TaxID=1396 RepID=UPI001F5B2884|nr:BppU family phage baseplate upper protein [Bacillus cereus]